MGTLEFISGMFTIAILKIAIVNIVGGALYGYVIGYVGVYTTLNSLNENCTRLDTKVACESVKHTKCYWDSNVGLCAFNDFNCTIYFHSESDCKNEDDSCFWDYGNKICSHNIGFNSQKLGIFAGAMTVGAVFGSFGAGPLMNRIGHKWNMALGGLICLICSILLHIARATDTYALHVIGRVVSGVSEGIFCVTAPAFVLENSPKEYLGPLSVLFQVFCTFGIFLAALIGLIAEPVDTESKQTNELRIQILIGFQTLISLICLILGFLMPATERNHSEESKEDEKEPVHSISKQYSWMSMTFPLFLATLMAFANQMTGMNAVMNYAPVITGTLGLRPMLGNFIIMLWNFVTTFISIPVSSRVSLRWMYLGGCGFGIIALIITAISIIPGVASSNTRIGVGFFGVLLFILCFEVGIGPPFFTLAQQLFPKSFRHKGSSYTLGLVFFFNIIINVFFPIAVTNLSGGPSGDQNIGMFIVYFFFAFCGTFSVVFLLKWLYPFEEEDNKQPDSTEKVPEQTQNTSEPLE